MPAFSNRDARLTGRGRGHGAAAWRCHADAWLDRALARDLLRIPHGSRLFQLPRSLRRPQLRRLRHDGRLRLYEDICEALLQRDDVDSSDVTVAVREGEVTPDGSVPQRCMRYLIEGLAAGHPSVTDVHNRIKVRNA